MAEQTSLTDEERRANLRKLEKQRDELERVSKSLAAAMAVLPGLLRGIDETIAVLGVILPAKPPEKPRTKSIAETETEGDGDG